MNYTEIAQRFNQENGRGMTKEDAKKWATGYQGIFTTGSMIEEFVELYAESVRLEERRKVKQVLREEFLLNTENYPKEYHKLFEKKFNRAMNELESLKSE